MARYLPFALALALLPAPSPTDAATPERWAYTDGWDVGYYPTTRGCLAFATFDGTGFFIGFDTRGRIPALDITMLDETWASIEPGTRYPVTLALGDEPPWILDMTGVFMDGAPGLNILVDASTDKAATFIEEFQRELRMTWSYGDAQLGHFTLRGSRRAFDEVLACQNAYDAQLPDPPALETPVAE